MGFAIVAAAPVAPDRFKGRVDLRRPVGHQPWKAQIAKGVEKVVLLFG